MAPKCCVPGCRSNYRSTNGYVSVFKFPTDPELKEKWLKRIPRKNWTPSKSSVVCAKHFLVSDIIVSDKYIDKSGVEHEVPRKNPALKKSAYPAVFSEGIAASYQPRSKISTSTVCCEKLSTSTIVKNKDVIKSAKVTKGVKLICKQRSETLEQVEQLLLKWITEIQCTSDSVSEAKICERAKLIHADLLKNTAGASQEDRDMFNHGWFVNFKKTWTDIPNVARHGEGANGDEDATDDFVTESEGFETNMFLKRPPNRTYIKQEEHLEVKQEKIEYDTDGEVDTLEDISSASDLNKIDNYVSSNHPSHNTHTCADVEQNRTVVYNSHSSVCVRENVLSDRTSNHQVITSENIKEEMCYTEDVRSGEGKNKKTQKEATESVIVIDFQTMMAGVKDGCNENREDLHQGNNILLEQGLSSCKKNSKCQQNDANIVMCGRKYLDEIFVNKWKTKIAASHKSSQPPVLQSVQLSVLQSNQPSVVQSFKCKFCHHGFLLNSSLMEHRLVQRGILPHICTNCGLAFRLDTVLMKDTNEQSEKKADKSTQFNDTFCKSDYSGDICQQNIFSKLMDAGKISYKCDICDHGFTTKFLLKMHTRTHTGEKPYKCDICGLGFAANSHLKIHKRRHTGEKPYKCGICGHGFAANSYLNTHKIIHSGVKPYKCHVCDRGFARNSDRKKHTRTHTGEKPYLCEICGRGFAKTYGLKIHTRTHTGDRSYNCDVCSRGFVLKGSLDIHKLTHTDEKPYQCDTCGLTFKHTNGLMQHTRTHIEGNPFKCDICGDGYRSKIGLATHKRTHTREKPEGECDICGKTFMYKSYLKIHKRVHTQERPYKCDVCEASFTIASTLKSHKLMHTGEKPYMCDICGLRVSRKSRLRLHKKVHTQERPYKCDVCGATYRQSSSLYTHKLIHTGEKPYMCSICGFRANLQYRLRLHKKVHKV